jgi:hypothetical protein
VAEAVGGVGADVLSANRDALSDMATPDATTEVLRLAGSGRIDVMATVLTWWTLAIEAAVAVTFLAPWHRLARHRDVALVTFVATTYAVAPVVGFGWVLVCLGLAQHDAERSKIRLAYLVAFLLVQAYTAPWTSLAGLTH